MPPKKTDVADAAEIPDRIRVKAISPIRYDGKTYGPGLPDGDELDVSAAERDGLVAAHAISEE